ncbi:S1-like domain-containing RNA-binding protein [Sulfurovum sp. XTW-4]|uniref:S1-like domain-containing RNA-binding protein n=1 Tax=Sulfurovum xiamenensis TaxID=3019066 RepID=A0ABT7QQL7_9BACT|nr:S1-like domain-containing RNA-binding protein [Sulfurovum xiamenensis]MDM5262834.1 S1-like domain-containing RNA-binding protein [Sulfurovum xiamenensis]
MNEKSKNLHIEIGKINTLEVARDTDYGLFLEAKDDSEVLLPNVYVMEDEMPIGALIDVFIYTDSEDRPVATTKMPYAKLGEYGYFTVVDYKSYGAFVNWGLPKDLFVPLSQQKEYFNIGKKYLLRVCLDEQTGRLYGTQKIGKYFNRDMSGLHQNKKLDAIVLAKTPLGFKVVADNQYEGMLFDNEIFEEIRVGDRKQVYIKKVRKDYKLDLSLQPIGKQAKISEAEGTILQLLKEADGTLPYTYKSDAEEIKKVFGMSKKNFKRTLTELIEAKKIELLDDAIVLL